MTLALARLQQGDLDDAESLALAALAAIDRQAPVLTGDAHMVLGRVAGQRGDRTELRSHCRAAAAALTAAAADRAVAQAWYELGSLLGLVGDGSAALDAFRRAAAATGLQPIPEALAANERLAAAAVSTVRPPVFGPSRLRV